MNRTYRGVTWNKNDILESKQALRVLLRNDIATIEEILELASKGWFGNLDVANAIKDC